MCPYETLPRAFITDQVPLPSPVLSFPSCYQRHFQQEPTPVIPGSERYQRYLLSSALQACTSPLSHPTHSVYKLTFRETGCPVQLSSVLFSPWIFVGCKPTWFLQSLTFSFTLSFYSQQLHCDVWLLVTVVTTWCSKACS